MYVLFVVFKPNFPVDSPNSNVHFFPTFCVVNNSANTCKWRNEARASWSPNGGHSARRSQQKAWKLGMRLNRVLVLREKQLQKALFSLAWHKKMSSVFGTGRSTNSMAWKLAKCAKFVLVLTNTQMLKKSRIFVNRIWKVRQSTSNWIVRILNEATSEVNI